MTVLIGVFLIAFLSAAGWTYCAREWATRRELLDRPDGRRGHETPVPRVGGVAVYLAATLTFVALATRSGWSGLVGAGGILPLLVGGTVVFLLGLYDDFWPLRARGKLIVEGTVAAGLYAAGLRVHNVWLIGGSSVHVTPWLSFGLTVVWIVGVTNALNLIDGSDGVAAGVAACAFAAFAALFAMLGNWPAALLAVVLMGAATGFLLFNFPPASIFLGDSGSLFLGFMLAAVGLRSARTGTSVSSLVFPMIALGLPILDTGLAIGRRFLRAAPVFEGDQGHVHHRLRDLGYSPAAVAGLLYAITAACAGLAFVVIRPAGLPWALALLVAFLAGLAVHRLRIPELEELRRIAARGLSQRVAIARNIRIREAVTRMREADDAPAIISALHYAIDSGEFSRAELWLSDAFGERVRAVAPHRAGDDGVLWRWQWQPEPWSPEWELRLSFRGPGEAALGRLSIWHASASRHMLTDVQLIASSLRHEMHAALLRAYGESPAEAAPLLVAPAARAGRLTRALRRGG